MVKSPNRNHLPFYESRGLAQWLRLVNSLNGFTVAGIGDHGCGRVDYNESWPGSPIPATDTQSKRLIEFERLKLPV
jgi:hypothetical protein